MAVSRINGTVDFIEESVFGTIPTNPALKWIGSVYSAKPAVKVKTETKRALPATTITANKAFNMKHIKVGTDIGLEIGYVPQTGSFLDFLVYAIGGTTAAPVSDTQKSISVVLQDANAASLKWQVFKGCVCTDFAFNAPEDGAIDCKATFNCQELAAPSATDPKGSGSHPSASTGAELTIDDISACQMKYSASGSLANCTDAINALSFKVQNKIGFSKDIANSTSTRIAGYAVNARSITLELDLDYAALETAAATGFSITDVRSLTAFDFAFTLDGKTYTFGGLKFPELPYEYGPDDLLGDKVTSLPATSLTVA
jgi:hypothetical protein